MTALKHQISEQHLQEIAAAIAEASEENGKVIITFAPGKRFVKVKQDYTQGSSVTRSRTLSQVRREFEQYL